MPISAKEYCRPLRPLRNPAHKDRYLAIDSTEQMFDKFTSAFENPGSWIEKGYLIVVTGDRGCGKTSLVQRCTYWLANKQQEDCEVMVLDLSDERWDQDTQERRIQRVFERITHSLRTYVTEEAMAELNSSQDLDDKFYFLGEALSARPPTVGGRSRPVAPVVLLPSHPLPEEVARYYELACPGTFFFAEVFDTSYTGNIETTIPLRKKASTDAYHLATTALKAGDVDLLVEWIREEQPAGPRLPETLVRERFDHLVAERKVSAAEINNLAWGVLQAASERGEADVTEQHFFQYYERIAFAPTSGNEAARWIT